MNPETDCQHHWVIEPANGPVSRGVCKLCQEVRDFGNSIDKSVWKIQSGNQRRDLTGTVGPGTISPDARPDREPLP
jgi:hypothetical protein